MPGNSYIKTIKLNAVTIKLSLADLRSHFGQMKQVTRSSFAADYIFSYNKMIEHVVHVVDFLFLLLSLNWIDFSSLYVRDTLVHIECEAVFRPRMPIFLLGK